MIGGGKGAGISPLRRTDAAFTDERGRKIKVPVELIRCRGRLYLRDFLKERDLEER